MTNPFSLMQLQLWSDEELPERQTQAILLPFSDGNYVVHDQSIAQSRVAATQQRLPGFEQEQRDALMPALAAVPGA